jgi:hypothetical protein
MVIAAQPIFKDRFLANPQTKPNIIPIYRLHDRSGFPVMAPDARFDS